jgi:hypothetical protein
MWIVGRILHKNHQEGFSLSSVFSFLHSVFVSNWTRFQLCQQKLQKKDKNYFSEKISEKMLKVDLLRESSVFQE